MWQVAQVDPVVTVLLEGVAVLQAGLALLVSLVRIALAATAV